MTIEFAKESQAKYLDIAPGDEIHVLKRIRYANNAPIMLDTSRIPVALASDLNTVDFEDSSLYSVLQSRYNIQVCRAKEIFKPVNIGKQESLYLKVPVNSPAIMLDRIAFSTNDRPIESCRSIVPGNKY